MKEFGKERLKTVVSRDNNHQTPKKSHRRIVSTNPNEHIETQFSIIMRESHHTLITKATDEVKLFLETALILTQYFYRKSINLAFERFATLVVETITQILF